MGVSWERGRIEPMSDIILDILRRYVDGTKIKKASARSGGDTLY